jgi:hypothetical protein
MSPNIAKTTTIASYLVPALRARAATFHDIFAYLCVFAAVFGRKKSAGNNDCRHWLQGAHYIAQTMHSEIADRRMLRRGSFGRLARAWRIVGTYASSGKSTVAAMGGGARFC